MAQTGRRPRTPALLALAAAVLLLAGAAILASSGVAALLSCDAGVGSPCTRLLFVGNSYTSVNDLPAVFRQLAASKGHTVRTGMVAPGGATLADHAASSGALTALAGSRWDLVVLQEQSQIPSIEAARRQEMYPAATRLAQVIRSAGAQPLLFETWAHATGWPENRLDYVGMQAAIDLGYRTIGEDLGARVVPVGDAWQAVRAAHPEIRLWQDDGSHPTTVGTYLAACVFYARVFGASPVGGSYPGDVPADEVPLLQEVAAAVTGTR